MAQLFDKLPFTQAIRALADRAAVTKPEFLELDAAARSRAFTMAWVDDLGLLDDIRKELNAAAAGGETPREFSIRLDRLAEQYGYEGPTGGNWAHRRLVYDMNMGMAQSAGRMERAESVGIHAWRYLPSIAHEPRADHAEYAGNLYRFSEGSPLPPIDFNCQCGWEVVTDEELAAMGLDWRELPVFAPPIPMSGFVWDASAYLGAA